MKIYVAGKWTEPEKINMAQQHFINNGHIITHDWTKFEPIKKFGEMTEEEEIAHDTKCAILDIEAIQNCDLVFAIMEDKEYAYRGTYTEIGCGLGLNKIIVIVCPPDTPNEKYYCRSNCFFYHPRIVHVNSLEEGYNYIKNL